MTSNDDDSTVPDGCAAALSTPAVDAVLNRSVTPQTDLYSTLGNETRYRILLVLTEADAPVCGCELEPHLDVGQSTVSNALSKLRSAGLVSRSKDGRWRYYEPTSLGRRLVELAESSTESPPAATN